MSNPRERGDGVAAGDAGTPPAGRQHPPATPFWEGYKRPPEMSARLIDALSWLLYQQPEQRLGQLIINAVQVADDLFNIYDENLLERMQAAVDAASEVSGTPGGENQ